MIIRDWGGEDEERQSIQKSRCDKTQQLLKRNEEKKSTLLVKNVGILQEKSSSLSVIRHIFSWVTRHFPLSFVICVETLITWAGIFYTMTVALGHIDLYLP